MDFGHANSYRAVKKGWGWEALTIFLASLFSLTRRYKSISILFPEASIGGRQNGLGVKPLKVGEGSKGADRLVPAGL